ncbi:hypothetical protein VCRA2119O147_2890002 [Vibrio crassostreae]|nr:hypothetical protein VCRA2113O322_130076 [Vibrio crassostreae]CAK1830596.1 hypothetical protein VCRA2113O140_10017 [Vibrio crassostreae]CAK1850778.1 hypothetical protein VCRA2119O145_10315 [Vibrio crassostreae]CAK1857488.1 hypothetical protein VCRA2118O144_10282 [Vibrio crassostreae]CAK1879549.1 hypothetical protein VCRA2113O138_10509 [Vibrio crassostreae]
MRTRQSFSISSYSTIKNFNAVIERFNKLECAIIYDAIGKTHLLHNRKGSIRSTLPFLCND